MIWLLDTSALVKRYVAEQGSRWLRKEITDKTVLISQLTPIEITAALARKYRSGDISEFAFYQARRKFLQHLTRQDYRVIEFGDDTVTEAMRLVFDL